MKSVLLDTNAYSLLRAKRIDVANYLDEADAVYVSTIVLGELYLGFLNGSKRKVNEEKLIEFLGDSKVQICCIGQETARIYSEIGYQLKKIGKPIPKNPVPSLSPVVSTPKVCSGPCVKKASATFPFSRIFLPSIPKRKNFLNSR